VPISLFIKKLANTYQSYIANAKYKKMNNERTHTQNAAIYIYLFDGRA